MVAEQREMVQRIDDNVIDIESNITTAHGELSKYLASMMSNRWLMLKMFGVLIVFVCCSLALYHLITDVLVVPSIYFGIVTHWDLFILSFCMFIIIGSPFS